MELFVLLFGVAAFVAYFVPSIIAFQRQASILAVLLINIFLGWTIIGWVAALALAGLSPSAGRAVSPQPFPNPPHGSPPRGTAGF